MENQPQEFNEFVNGFHKRKLQRRKEAAIERLEKQKSKEAAQKLQRKKQKKMVGARSRFFSFVMPSMPSAKVVYTDGDI